MNTPLRPRLSPRFLAGFGTLAVLGGLGLASSRPAHTAGGPIAVSIANAPLSTTPTDNPNKQGVQFTSLYFIADGAQTAGRLGVYKVPAGKRLVIETVTGTSLALQSNAYNIYFRTVGGLGSTFVRGAFDLLPNGTVNPSASTHPHQYAEAGTMVEIEIVRAQAGGDAPVAVVFTGCLVDIATPGGSS